MDRGAAELAAGRGLVESVAGFVHQLRVAGLPVSMTEHVDAMGALEVTDVTDREGLQATLAATMVKRQDHLKAFNTLFDVWFAPQIGALRPGDENAVEQLLEELFTRPGEGDDAEAGEGGTPGEGGNGGSGGAGGDGLGDLSNAELAARLGQAMRRGDPNAYRAVAREAVQRYSGMETGRPVGGSYYLFRTLRQLNVDGLIEQLLAEAQEVEGEVSDPLTIRLRHDDLHRRGDEVRAAVEDEIRRLLVADRGAEAMARTVRKPLPEDLDFMHASREELAELRRALGPLTRKLADRLAHKRRHRRRGTLDFRRTVRASLSTGGVPVRPRFRKPSPHKPDLVVVADISGSVAAFARFTLVLMYALASSFSKVRSFVFIDGIDEVTEYFEGTEDIDAAVARVNSEADVVRLDGHSDYGLAFGEFAQRYPDAVTSKTTVVFLGDARNNYHQANDWVVAEAAEKARRVYWLNPEPRAYWDTGDSIVSRYGAWCDGVFEVRNLRQLEHFVELLE